MWCLNELFKMGSQGKLEDSIYVLYVSPLKALNNDIQKNLVEPLKGIREYARKAGIDVPDVRSQVRTGDTTTRERAEMARRPPHILITTPESLFIILSTRKFREALRTVRYVIVDEIHAMSDNKRGVHLSLSLERLQRLAKGDFVRIGLSATQRPLDEIARFLVGMGDGGKCRECEIVDVGARKNLNVKVISPVDNLLETHFDAIWGSTYDKLISMIREHRTTLIFTNSRYKTERIALRLNELSADEPVAVGAHHGSMSKVARLQMEDKLKEGKLDALVATSSLELGIDVGSVDLVCQMQSPKSVSKGLQRVGRAGHLLDATSEGRLFVTDRDDLVESAVLVKAILDGQIDTTRVLNNCLDVLAQHIVGAVAADDWNADDLFDLCRHSYCYRELKREDFDKVLDMLSGNYTFNVEQPPYPKILWDKVNGTLTPERGARLIAFRSSGTIPDVADYDVYFEKRETKVGQLDEGFVEELRVGDVFILGSSSWRVIGIHRNRVIVEDVYGQAPTIPFWMGERDSRTFDLAMLVGRFRREMETHIEKGDEIGWLKKEYRLDENCAKAISEYFREQKLVTRELPSDKLVIIENFHDELGRQQIVIHSSFGIRVNDTWAMALCQAIEEGYGFRPQDATVDDGILITVPKGKIFDPECLPDLVTIDNVERLLYTAIPNSPIFSSRFRHNAVRALLVLREYRGRKTPVWLQNLRSSALLEACLNDGSFPLITETFRECTNEALDMPDLMNVLSGLRSGEICIKTLSTNIPSPFVHSLLLLGQYGEIGSIPSRERRSRLVHLRRELLKQILDEETLSNLLDQRAVEEVDSKLQHMHPLRRARNSNELARVLLELGDLVDAPGDEISLLDRTDGDARLMLSELVSSRRAVLVSIPTVESNRERWISTENFPLYKSAFGVEVRLDDTDMRILRSLEGKRPISQIRHATERRIERLMSGYVVLRVLGENEVAYVAANAWIPKHIRENKMSRQEARLTLIQKYVRSHGPMTKYEIMERYGFTDQFVERALENQQEAGIVAKGEYMPTKPFPQWCYKSNLEEIHRLTLNRLRKEMEPATPVEYADLIARLQHAHPDTRLSGIDGLREVIEQIQGYEDYQVVFERHVFPTRVKDYDPSMLDRLCYGGEVFWRRFDYKDMRRGRIGFCFRKDRDWIVANPNEVPMDLTKWDEDIGGACGAVREFLVEKGACFFDEIVEGTGIDRNLVLRAVWHLVWTGEATNDNYESIRHANISCGLSGCYDLATKPRRKGVTIDLIVRHMLKNHKLDPTLGRWAPSERLIPASVKALDPGDRALMWANLLLKRYGVVCRESLEREVGVPEWKDVRRALLRLELLGKVRRGFFVQELSGEQYAYPETVDALRDMKLKYPDAGTDEEYERVGEHFLQTDRPMVLLNACDPANPFTFFFPMMNEVGVEVKFMRTANKFLVIEAGQPVLLFETFGSLKLLADMPKEKAEKAVRVLMQIIDNPAAVGTYKEIHVRDWNGNPIDVSPARHLLTKLGFVDSKLGWKGYVYDGTEPNGTAVAKAEKQFPELFERAGKEKAPVKYDAEWIISRSPKDMRQKVRELIVFLSKILPKECEIAYYPRNFAVLYRGVKCISPYIQRKRIWLQITHKGWTRGIPIEPDTDLSAPDFVFKIRARFEETKKQIDSLLEPQML